MANETTSKRGRKAKAAEKVDFKTQLWNAADAMRGNLDAAVYKHVLLGLIFLKYISEKFEERYEEIAKEYEEDGEEAVRASQEDPDEYIAENIFWVPEEARWQKIASAASTSAIGLVSCNIN